MSDAPNRSDTAGPEAEEFQCPACRGMGEVRGPERGMPWLECRACDGTGAMTKEECEAWHDRQS